MLVMSTAARPSLVRLAPRGAAAEVLSHNEIPEAKTIRVTSLGGVPM